VNLYLESGVKKGSRNPLTTIYHLTHTQRERERERERERDGESEREGDQRRIL